MSEIHNASKADQLLKDELIINAFTTLENYYLSMFRDAKLDDIPKQTQAKQLLHLLESFKSHFESVIRDGKIAQEKQSFLQKLRN